MKRTHNKLMDSDDDMDHLPLKYITLNNKKNKSINELRRYSTHECEFCERVFENRYDHLIHNAKHIIIPLIKMLPRHCTECPLCFFSEEEMNAHMSVDHNIFNKPKIFSNSNSKSKVPDTCKLEGVHKEDEIIDDDVSSPSPLNCLVKKKDVVVMKTENILQNFMTNCKVDIEKFIPKWQYESDEYENNDEIDTNQNDFKNVVEYKPPTIQNTSNGVTFKNNIVELTAPPKLNDICKRMSKDVGDDPIVTLPSLKKEVVTECSINQDSTHFEDLIKPGIFYCKRCYKRFPNRFEVIVHEIVHLNITLTVPETYNFNSQMHSANTIPLAPNTTSKYVASHKCHEEISDKNLHAKTCFKFHCSDCSQGFNEKNLLLAHEAKCIGLAVVMCDTCLYLRKRLKHVQYYGIIRFNNLEVKQLCRWCGKLCNEMSQVTLVNRQRLADRINFEGDIGEQETSIEERGAVESEKFNDQVKEESSKVGQKKKGDHKILSNRERLKLIQTRLRLMKK